MASTTAEIYRQALMDEITANPGKTTQHYVDTVAAGKSPVPVRSELKALAESGEVHKHEEGKSFSWWPSEAACTWCSPAPKLGRRSFATPCQVALYHGRRIPSDGPLCRSVEGDGPRIHDHKFSCGVYWFVFDHPGLSQKALLDWAVNKFWYVEGGRADMLEWLNVNERNGTLHRHPDGGYYHDTRCWHLDEVCQRTQAPKEDMSWTLGFTQD